MKIQLLFSMLLLTVTVFADDLTTLSGKKYTGVTVTRVEPNGISISHDDGIAKVSFADLSEELRTKYGYDPKKAAAFMQGEQAAAAERAGAAMAAATAKEDEKRAVCIWGHIMSTPKEGLVVECTVEEAGYLVAYDESHGLTKDRPKPISGTFLITGHPRAATAVDKELIDVDVVEDGTAMVFGKSTRVKKMRVIKTVR